MNSIMKLSVIPFLLTLGACSSGSGSNNLTGASGSAVSVITVKGNTLDLTGTWKTACYTANGGTGSASDVQEMVVFSNTGTIEYSSNSFTSADASCSGGQSVARRYAANVTVKDALAITNWKDGMDQPVGPPTAQDNSPLSNNESFTDLVFTITMLENMEGGIQVGNSLSMGYVVDDTSSATTILYRLENNNPQPSSASAVDPFIKM